MRNEARSVSVRCVPPQDERGWENPGTPDSFSRMSEPENLPMLVVIQRSDAFRDVWASLAEHAGVKLIQVDGGAELPSPAETSAVLVIVAGEEARAGAALEGLPYGARLIAAVGADDDRRVAIAALRAGAGDYFALPADLPMLRAWVEERAADRLRDDRARTLVREERTRYDFSRMIGESPGLRSALERAARVIPRGSATILVTGETGTGKELLAQAIHYNGPRAAQPFVEVNCSALPANLLEAELFGYEKGAFTGAVAAKPGLFEAAHRGTLFLDEIGEIPIELQAKLLRALESRTVRRVGSVQTIQVDVRVVAATHRDLRAEVRANRFREDLFYRLNVLPIELPSLRDRGDDVLRLADYFLGRFADEYGMPAPRLDDDVRRALLSYPWPGNVRELRNSIERAMLLGEGTLAVEDLFAGGAPASDGESAGGGVIPFPATMDEVEMAAARAMVARFDGNKSAAADALGISRSRLYRLLGEES